MPEQSGANELERDEQYLSLLLTSGKYIKLAETSLADEELHAFLLKRLEELYQGRPVIVTLTGAPASGKTTLCDALLHKLQQTGHPSESISTDGFNLYSRTERNDRIKHGANPLEVKDFDLNERIVQAVRMDKAVAVPVYNEANGDAIVRPKNEWQRLTRGLHFLIEEGDFQPLDNPDLRLYFHVPTDIRRRNRIERDLKKRGGYGDAAAIAASFDARLAGQYYPYTLPQAEKADILIVAYAEQTGNHEYTHQYTYDLYERTEVVG